ncbi:molybdenum cofactor biosynthesis prote [Suillus lakei]|nr:molybdenum cofactor biosynthesis prote [Suillus lakei]
MSYQQASWLRSAISRKYGPACLRYYSQSTRTTTRATAQLKIAHIDAQRQFSPALVDSFHRRHDYLRISLTERCNLRYLFVRSGVTKIRLTGGEPTVRKGRLNELRPLGLESIGMTTNGIALHRRLPLYVENGLTHLNLSLDTLDPFKFEIMTRRPGHDAVLRSLDVALHSPGLRSVKLNVVVIKGLNDSEVLDFVRLTADKNISVRFIEFMPFTGNKWDKAKMLPSSQLLDIISREHPSITRAPDELNDTARSWKIPGHVGSLGFISSMSDHFCSSCNRLRLTADGQIKVCLFDAKEVSLRDEMRRGASDAELLNGKQEKHAGMEDIDVITNRPMILIGVLPASGRIYIPRSAYDLSPSWQRSWAANEPSDLIPLCHPLQISNVSVTLTPERDVCLVSPPGDQGSLEYSIKCTATVACEGKTGVEMEALTAVSVGLLTVWDMLKAVAGKEMKIGEIIVTHKTGGKSGDFTRGS